jgi:hypothetical protein
MLLGVFVKETKCMSTALKEAKCPNCGSLLPKGSPEGLCPGCLLEAGAETKTAEGQAPKAFEPPPVEEIAKLFPQLSILKLIGAGGMGAVYQARQPVLDRFVALKILPPGRAGGINFEERFNREARALARLNHPNIVAVHEFGQVQALHYFIMEYVDGANLRQLEKAARLSPREALQVIPQICDALQYAHDEGVVHRDIKPENVLVDRRGRVKIADFGLAKILGLEADQGRLTAEGQVMGTPHYMAPEQIERPLKVDHRADIYSLGVVIYEMLTGDLPIGKFPPPSRKISVDVRLDEVVLRSLENDPARRYQRASEVKSDLETISATVAPTTPEGAEPAKPATSKGTERQLRWAGIALAVERDGEREITWNGGLTAVTCGLLMIFLGMGIFGVVTGLPRPGVPGMPLLIMMIVLGAGFRWVLNRPLPADGEPRLAANGTVIMAAPRRRLDWGFYGMAGIAVGVFGWGLVLNYAIPSIKRQFKPLAAQVAKLDAATGKLSVNLPGRGQVELLAVSYADPAPNHWWRPNGTPITNELWQIENPGIYSYSNALLVSTNRQLILQLSDLPNGAIGPSFEFEPQGIGSISGGYVLKGATHAEGANGLLLGMPPQTKTLTMRVGFGLQPWRKVVSRGAQSQSSSSEWRPGDPSWDVNFNSVNDLADGAQVTVVMGPENRSWNRRVVAVDTNGTVHTSSIGQGTPRQGSATWTYAFRGVRLGQLEEFRVEVQPVHWVEFRNIRLNPKLPLPYPDRLRFGAPREISTSDFIDFDAGQVMVEPAGTNSNNFFQGMTEIVGWMERSGLDAAVGNRELQPLGMTFVALENEHWESLSPTELTTKLHQGAFRPNELKPWKNGELPSTFGFRTREGGTGILQLLVFEADRPGVTLRYKLIQRPTLEAR